MKFQPTSLAFRLTCIAAIAVTVLVVIAVRADAPATQPAAATQPATRASDALLDRVQKQLREVNTVESDFVQEKNLVMMNHILTIRGHFALQKPDRVIWIVNEPVRYAISVQGDEVRQWDQDTNKVQTIHVGSDPTFKAISEQIQAWFMGDYKALAQNYDVFVQSEKPLSLLFVPRSDTVVSKILQQVVVRFGDQDKYIDQMVVHETGGSVTKLTYVNAKLNQPIAKESWEIPPHVR